MIPGVGTMIHRLRVVAIVACLSLALATPGSGQALLYSLFERYVDSLRQQTGIPGLSVVIVKDGQIGWERGFGAQDLERNVLAAPDTPYVVGGLTQTLTAVLLGACAEQGRLNIDAPISQWAPDFPAPQATVRHVLSHASDGGAFEYDEDRFARLSAVFPACTPKPFREHLSDSILERLGMAGSVPGQDLAAPGADDRESFEPAQLSRYADVLARLAVPYRVDRSGRATRSDYRFSGLTAADGLVTTARDVARFDAALDDLALLRRETLNAAWTQANYTGTPLPTGLGWFVQNYQSEHIIWQFGAVSDAYSALILKMPARRLTLIMLANSDGLSTGANLKSGDVTQSPFVKIFLRLFG
jgi:CubicO group peptidase (beta-lactamase class C family)